MSTNPTVAFHTLGCKLNFSETSTLSRSLQLEGFHTRQFGEQADVYVINTCSVTENADKECRYLVRKIQRNWPDAYIVITGCYAQLKPQDISKIYGVDLVLGVTEKFNIGSHLKGFVKKDTPIVMGCEISEVTGFNNSYSYADRTRAFLKIQDGCDYNCSFCTIPMARGKSRSGRISEIVSQVESLVEKGIQEVILTGVNIGDFGKGESGGKKYGETLFELVEQLDKINGVQRFRISSIEPNLLTLDLIDFVAGSNKFMPHFHIPLQSGSNSILRAMRRRYQKELYAEKISMIKSVIGDCGIGADVIVGFPGETDILFQETVDFISKLNVSYLHVFTYSERDGTDALGLGPIVPQNIRNERNRALRKLSIQKQFSFENSQVGLQRNVLFEKSNTDGMMEGYTDNYIRVSIPYTSGFVNKIIPWVL